jgi:hypothetical protein
MTQLDKPKRFGYSVCMTNKAAQALGKLGGKVKSKAKAKASRENGKLGGRPPSCPKCSTPGAKVWHATGQECTTEYLKRMGLSEK